MVCTSASMGVRVRTTHASALRDLEETSASMVRRTQILVLCCSELKCCVWFSIECADSNEGMCQQESAHSA